MSKHILKKVRELWAPYDPEAKGYIKYREFFRFTQDLLNHYQKKYSEDSKLKDIFYQKRNLLKKLNLTVYENEEGVLCFQFHETI